MACFLHVGTLSSAWRSVRPGHRRLQPFNSSILLSRKLWTAFFSMHLSSKANTQRKRPMHRHTPQAHTAGTHRRHTPQAHTADTQAECAFVCLCHLARPRVVLRFVVGDASCPIPPEDRASKYGCEPQPMRNPGKPSCHRGGGRRRGKTWKRERVGS